MVGAFARKKTPRSSESVAPAYSQTREPTRKPHELVCQRRTRDPPPPSLSHPSFSLSRCYRVRVESSREGASPLDVFHEQLLKSHQPHLDPLHCLRAALGGLPSFSHAGPSGAARRSWGGEAAETPAISHRQSLPHDLIMRIYHLRLRGGD